LDRIQKNYANKPRQAVFLVNGQVYFGKIEKENDRYLVLREIYYLKTQDQLNQNNPDKKVSIIKLGDEVHSPEDRMYISRDQILFYEQMRKESKINEAINKYLAEKK
jgi:alpha-D-ribose 1-methylphosphonate 5-triphosphate diphosphatase PhnM